MNTALMSCPAGLELRPAWLLFVGRCVGRAKLASERRQHLVRNSYPTPVVAGTVFAVFPFMKNMSKAGTAAIAVVGVWLTASPMISAQQTKVVDQIVQAEQPALTPADKETIKRFEQRLKQYVKQRATVKAKAPKLSKDSTAEQIQAAENGFVEGLRTKRAGARPGDLFAPDIAQYIRTTLKREFTTVEKKEIRNVVLERETNIPVPLKVNYPYPDPKEFVEMPATLLLKLPPLPKELKYRYVGRNLMLLDTDSSLIIDYMVNALP